MRSSAWSLVQGIMAVTVVPCCCWLGATDLPLQAGTRLSSRLSRYGTRGWPLLFLYASGSGLKDMRRSGAIRSAAGELGPRALRMVEELSFGIFHRTIASSTVPRFIPVRRWYMDTA